MDRRDRRRFGVPLTLTIALALAAVLAVPATAQAQWENMRRSAGELERLLQEAPFEIQSSRGARAPEDRTRQLSLSFGDGSPVLVKMIPAPRGGEDFNNRPHYEAAAYELQKLFLDPEEYVVPPTVCRCLPVWLYRELDADADATFEGTSCRLVTLQSWLWGVTDVNVFDRDRFERDTLYARHFANTNVLTYLIEHKDANVGNLLVAEDSTLGRVYAVDNGVAFESRESNRGSRWRQLRVERIPLSTVERLRGVELEDLTERLAVLVQYEQRDGQIALVEPSAPLDAGDGIRVEDGTIQLGLKQDEIEDVHDRIRDLLERIDEGDLETFGATVLPASGGAAAVAPEVSVSPPGAQEAPAITFEGEHGLAVFLEDGRVEVRWLTDASSRGLLEAKVDGRTLHRDTTPEALDHRTHFARPAGSEVVLRYGALADASGGGGGLHETTITLEDPSTSVRDTSRDVDSLFVVGDVHGEFERLRSLLHNAGLVDGDGTWTGGESHLVFLGDLFDRGPDVLPLLWFVYRLEREARATGGRVHVVLGNHEIMVLTGDLRYVSGRESIVASRHGMEYSALFDVQRSLLGRWLASKPAALVIDDVLLAHGGVGPAFEGRSVASINDSLRAYVSEDLFRAWADTTVEPAPVDSAALERRTRFFFEAPSVFWYRGYATSDTLDDLLARTLDRNDARLHVVAHTAVPTIRETYDGRLILVDLQRPAAELLLLVRSDGGWERHVYGLEGSARPLRR